MTDQVTPKTLRPLCFVVMPFGQKRDPAGGPDINFDAIYENALKPAIEESGLEPLRADSERTGGIIHQPMFERLLLCEYVVADLTTANANVFYELGVRHAARPATTLTVFASKQPIPFDVNYLRSLPYTLGDNNSFGEEQATALRLALSARLVSLRDLSREEDSIDSPLFQLVSSWRPPLIAREKTDVFRDHVRQDEAQKRELQEVRILAKRKETLDEAATQLAHFRARLGPLHEVPAATVIDLMLTYRALSDWSAMIELCEAMPESLKRQILVREQLAFAFNRRAGKNGSEFDRMRALEILEDVEKEQGSSSETCGLIGRIHKDRWRESLRAQQHIEAQTHLNAAIDAYRRGYFADPRDAFPGINVLTLLDVKGDDKARDEERRLLPVVRFAVDRRLQGKKPDYWDHATMLELAVLGNDELAARQSLGSALAAVRERWEPETTANNLNMIADARKERGETVAWLSEIIDELAKRAAR
jgi:hypothetical protein